MIRLSSLTIIFVLLFYDSSSSQTGLINSQKSEKPVYTSLATVLVRSKEPFKLAEYYEFIGFKRIRTVADQGVVFYLEGNVGSLEILPLNEKVDSIKPKSSRMEQGVLAIFETDDLDKVLERARLAGSTFIETWTHPTGVSIHYIADPSNNILGFASRQHNPNLKTH